MNRVAVNTEYAPLPGWEKALKKYALDTLAFLGKDAWDLSILLCGDTAIAALNRQYRGKSQATDILSFSQNEGQEFPLAGGRRAAGDLVISLDTLRKNARRLGLSEDEELRRLLIHGILHLDGMNHRTNKAQEPMLQLQERVLHELRGRHIIGRNA